jgi:hypothetical protein
MAFDKDNPLVKATESGRSVLKIGLRTPDDYMGHWVDIDLAPQEIELPFEQFAERFLRPTWAALREGRGK